MVVVKGEEKRNVTPVVVVGIVILTVVAKETVTLKIKE